MMVVVVVGFLGNRRAAEEEEEEEEKGPPPPPTSSRDVGVKALVVEKPVPIIIMVAKVVVANTWNWIILVR